MSSDVRIPDQVIDGRAARYAASREERDAAYQEAKRCGLIVAFPERGYVAWSDEVEDALVESFCRGASVKAACAAARVDRGNFYAHFVGEFRERVEAARESLIGAVENALVKSAVEPDKNGRRDVNAQKFLLLNRASDRYKEQLHLNATSDLVEPMKAPEDNYTPDQRKKLQEVAHERLLLEPGDPELPY